MEKELDINIIKATQSSLGKYVKRPPLSEKLLKKPPFRFLHDIVTTVLKTTGFFEGLFEENELVSDNVKDRESKISFLNKVITVVALTTGKSLSIKPSKIVAGQEPDKTNELLQCLAQALDNNLSSTEAVSKYKEGDKTAQNQEKLKKKIIEEVPKTKKNEKDENKSTSKINEKLSKQKEDTNERSSTRKIKERTDNSLTRNNKERSDHSLTRNNKEKIERSLTRNNKETNSITKPKQAKLEVNQNRNDSKKEASSKKQTLSTNNAKNTKAPAASETQKTEKNIETSHNVHGNEKPENIPLEINEEINDIIIDTKDKMENDFPQSNNVQHNDVIENGINSSNMENNNEKTEIKDVKMESVPNDNPIKVDDELNTDNINKIDQHDEQHNFQYDTKSKTLENVENVNDSTSNNIANKKDFHKTGVSKNENINRNSLRPQSVRPSSSRPGAPRLREKHDENYIPTDNLLVGKVNIIIENTPNDEEEESSLVVVEALTANSENKMEPENLKSTSDRHGHLVQQILDSQKEFSQITSGKTEIEWEFDSQKTKEASSHEIEQMRFNIEALSRITNPLGKLFDHIQEDCEVMRQELQQWTEHHQQAAKELAKQKTANEEFLLPMLSKIKQLDADIEGKREKINDLKIIIHRNSSRINNLLASGNVQ